MDITITGISGFVGQNLSNYLQAAMHTVHGLSLRNEGWKGHLVKTDTALIHLAGKAHDTSNVSDSSLYYAINRDLSIDLFNQFLQSDIRDFFYFSSVKAVADTVEDVLIETSISNPVTPYGISKKEAEDYMLAQTLPADKRLFIIRPCMIHGPGNKGNLNLLYHVVEKNIPWPLASFHNKRSFLSIDNLNYLIYTMLMNADIPSGVYNFADDDSLSTNDLVTLIARSLKKNNKLWYLSPRLIKCLVSVGDFIPLPLNSERLKKLTESYVVSNLKIKTAIGIAKLPVTVEEGLAKTIKSFSKGKLDN